MTPAEVLVAFGAALLKHPELFTMLLTALQGGQITGEQATQALRVAMKEASDAEMRREFGG